jgi:hypothetical protein
MPLEELITMHRIRFMPEDEAKRTKSSLLSTSWFRLTIPLFLLLLYLALPLYLWGFGIGHEQAEITPNLSTTDQPVPNTRIATGRAIETLISNLVDVTAIQIKVPRGVNGAVLYLLFEQPRLFEGEHPLDGE